VSNTKISNPWKEGKHSNVPNKMKIEGNPQKKRKINREPENQRKLKNFEAKIPSLIDN